MVNNDTEDKVISRFVAFSGFEITRTINVNDEFRTIGEQMNPAAPFTKALIF